MDLALASMYPSTTNWAFKASLSITVGTRAGRVRNFGIFFSFFFLVLPKTVRILVQECILLQSPKIKTHTAAYLGASSTLLLAKRLLHGSSPVQLYATFCSFVDLQSRHLRSRPSARKPRPLFSVQRRRGCAAERPSGKKKKGSSRGGILLLLITLGISGRARQ